MSFSLKDTKPAAIAAVIVCSVALLGRIAFADDIPEDQKILLQALEEIVDERETTRPIAEQDARLAAKESGIRAMLEKDGYSFGEILEKELPKD